MKFKFLAAFLGVGLLTFPLISCAGTPSGGLDTGSSNTESSSTDTGGSNAESSSQDPVYYCTVTFETPNGTVEKKVARGAALTDIPALPTEAGYTYTWCVSDFSAVSEDLTVTLIKTANVYTIFYDTTGMDGTFQIGTTAQKVTYGQPFTLEKPTRDFHTFQYWEDENGQKFTDGVYDLTEDITLKGVWKPAWSGIG